MILIKKFITLVAFVIVILISESYIAWQCVNSQLFQNFFIEEQKSHAGKSCGENIHYYASRENSKNDLDFSKK